MRKPSTAVVAGALHGANASLPSILGAWRTRHGGVGVLAGVNDSSGSGKSGEILVLAALYTHILTLSTKVDRAKFIYFSQKTLLFLL